MLDARIILKILNAKEENGRSVFFVVRENAQ
jgi:hypothetical protein